MANPTVAAVVQQLVHEGKLTAQDAQRIVSTAASTSLNDLTKTLQHHGLAAHQIQVILKATGAQ